MALELPNEGATFRMWKLEKAFDSGNSGKVYRATKDAASGEAARKKERTGKLIDE